MKDVALQLSRLLATWQQCTISTVIRVHRGAEGHKKNSVVGLPAESLE